MWLEWKDPACRRTSASRFGSALPHAAGEAPDLNAMQGLYNEDVSDIYDKVGRAIDRVCAAADSNGGSPLEEVVGPDAEGTLSLQATGAKLRAAVAPAQAHVKWRFPTVAEGGNPTSRLGLASLLELHGQSERSWRAFAFVLRNLPQPGPKWGTVAVHVHTQRLENGSARSLLPCLRATRASAPRPA